MYHDQPLWGLQCGRDDLRFRKGFHRLDVNVYEMSDVMNGRAMDVHEHVRDVSDDYMNVGNVQDGQDDDLLLGGAYNDHKQNDFHRLNGDDIVCCMMDV